MQRNTQTRLGALAALALSLGTSVAEARPYHVAQLPTQAIALTDDSVIWSSNDIPPRASGRPNTADLYTIDEIDPFAEPERIYHEERTTSIMFGSVLHQRIAGIPYVYFVANYDDWITYIKRVPLLGGNAQTLVRTPFIGARELKTDGTFLYWCDTEGVRRMPLGGGAITTLYRTSTATTLDLDDHYLYFNAGTFGNSLHRTPKAGGAVTLQHSANSTIMDLDVHARGSSTDMYWSELGGTVGRRTVGSNDITYFQYPRARSAVSVAFDGARVLWIDCNPGEYFNCGVHEVEDGQLLHIMDANEPTDRMASGGLVTRQQQVYWGSPTHLTRYQHGPRPYVSLSPSQLIAFRQGTGGVTATLTATISSGEIMTGFEWWAEDANFNVTAQPRAHWIASVYAAVTACEDRETTVYYRVTDAIGRSATASVPVKFTATKVPGQPCP